MRELHTIEVNRYVPTEKRGIVRHVGMISPQEAFDALEKHLRDADLLPDEYFNSNSYVWGGVKELPEYTRASCDVYWGGSEGIYLDVSLLYHENGQLQRFMLATGKTLGETGDDFLRMSRIAAECSMMLNGRGEIIKFYNEEKNYIKSNEQNFKSLDSVIKNVQKEQETALSNVVQFLGSIKTEDEIAEFKRHYSFTPDEILADSSFVSRIVSEKQRLIDNYPNHYREGSKYVMRTALHNVCLAQRETITTKKLTELKKLKENR